MVENEAVRALAVATGGTGKLGEIQARHPVVTRLDAVSASSMKSLGLPDAEEALVALRLQTVILRVFPVSRDVAFALRSTATPARALVFVSAELRTENAQGGSGDEGNKDDTGTSVGELVLAGDAVGLRRVAADLPAACPPNRRTEGDTIARQIQDALGGSPPIERRHRPLHIGSLCMRPGSRTYVMGVLNVTPDSFSDGGAFFDAEGAVARALQMIEEGADIIDVGGESTRPGADPVTEEEELRRVIPVIRKLAASTSVPISVDTFKSRVAAEALAAGAALVNDITGLRGDPRMARLVAEAQVPVVLMHMQGTPRTMQIRPTYNSVVGDVLAGLQACAAHALENGIHADRIIVDPGIGFGKTVAHNLELLRRLADFHALGFPVLVGTSRKSVIGHVLNLGVHDRMEGTAATVALAVAHGADIVRVHDIKQMVRVIKMADAVVRGRVGEAYV